MKYNKNNKITLIITFMIIIITFLTGNIFGNGFCSPACTTDEECSVNNPYIEYSCEVVDDCTSRCKYVIPNDIEYTEKIINSEKKVREYTIQVKENINKIKDGNETALAGTLNINKDISDRYFLFVLKDPSGLIIKNINRVHFNVEPFKVTDTSVLFLLEKASEVHAITYYIEPELSRQLIDKTNIAEKGLSKDTSFREPTISEKTEIMTNEGISIGKMLTALGWIALIIVTCAIGFIFYRKNNDDRQVKPLEEKK